MRADRVLQCAAARIVSSGIFRSAGRPAVIDNAVVGTISVTTVLIVYDGWPSLRLLGVVAIIVGPVLATFIAHGFAAVLAEHSALGRSLTKSELLDAVGAEWGFSCSRRRPSRRS